MDKPIGVTLEHQPRAYHAFGHLLGPGEHFAPFATDRLGDTWVIVDSNGQRSNRLVCRYHQHPPEDPNHPDHPVQVAMRARGQLLASDEYLSSDTDMSNAWVIKNTRGGIQTLRATLVSLYPRRYDVVAVYYDDSTVDAFKAWWRCITRRILRR